MGELAQIVATLRPDIKVLYLSGYFDGAEEERRKDEGANFMQKPSPVTGTLVRKSPTFDIGLDLPTDE